METLSLCYSPCPNDTFIFGAIAKGLLPASKNFAFYIRLLDIAELNNLALCGEPDICKVSFYAAAHLPEYQLLNSGAALGRGCGPLLVTQAGNTNIDLAQAKIAIPGTTTTANLLLHFYNPAFKNTVAMRFDEIMPAVANGTVDAGVIIHESRFTYTQYGLVCLQDLGEYWERKTGYPIPLGGIVAHKRLGESLIHAIDSLIYESITYAFHQPASVMDYVQTHAQQMDLEVMQAHIALYVNNFSLALGKDGKEAVQTFNQVVAQLNLQ